MTGSNQAELFKFVDKYIDNLLDWALLVFFYSNPGTTDRMSDLAVRLGRREVDVKKSIERFVSKGLLRKIGSGQEPVFVFEPDKKTQEQIGSFMDAIATPDVRVNLLARVFDRKGIQ